MKKLKAVWEVTRLEHGLIYGLGVVAGVFISLGYFDLRLSVFGFLTALFLQASAFALNDYYDYEVDRANKRFDRPLVRGDLSRREALWIAVAFAFPGFLFALYISPLAFALALAITLFGYLYDVKLKEYGVAGNVYIAFSMAAPFLFGAIVAGRVNTEVVVLSLIAFLSGLAREIMKGIEDVEGDALRDVKTVARIYGVGVASRVSALLFILAVIASMLVLVIPEYRDLKYILPVSVTDYLLLSTSRKLLKGVEKEEIGRLRKRTMLALSVGLLAFLLGSM
ncbi:MAG: UbiA family prenyltransferase [Archaeoglobi archaeon]|nr:UbiA family prenyltransferase [Archaeoglobi archaeon]